MITIVYGLMLLVLFDLGWLADVVASSTASGRCDYCTGAAPAETTDTGRLPGAADSSHWCDPGTAPLPARPWHEVKSRRGKPNALPPRALPARHQPVCTITSRMPRFMPLSVTNGMGRMSRGQRAPTDAQKMLAPAIAPGTKCTQAADQQTNGKVAMETAAEIIHRV